MKVCAACHEDLPKDSYSKKQWKLDKFQRRCKVCVTNNQEVKPPSNNTNTNTNRIVKALDSLYLEDDEKISEEELFKQPPPAEDCPICFLLLPTFNSGRKYQTCCGKEICSGCLYAVIKTKKTAITLCPFCRVPAHTSDEEANERDKKRKEKDDPIAIFNLGCYYRDGKYGFRQDRAKALKLWYRAAELGYSKAYCSVGVAHYYGRGVEVDEKKATYYYELAAVGGDVSARYNLGYNEERAGNMERALKHYMIAVSSGDAESLNQIKELYTNGYATKDDYTRALQLYQTYLGEITSIQRDEAAAADEIFRYY